MVTLSNDSFEGADDVTSDQLNEAAEKLALSLGISIAAAKSHIHLTLVNNLKDMVDDEY